MSDRGFYYDDLAGILEIYLDNYEDDREIYWSEKLEEIPLADVLYDQAERFAKVVLTNTEQLVSAEQLDQDLRPLDKELVEIGEWKATFWERLAAIIDPKQSIENNIRHIRELQQQIPTDAQEANSPLRLVWERFCIKMARDVLSKIKSGADKILQLYILVLKSSPSQPTRDFLSRLSRCYIFGFDPECIILCRSVIDTAFKETVNDEICIRHLGPRKGDWFGLLDRIQAALKEGIIDEHVKGLAITVKKRGDKAIHYQPDITKDVWQTIRDTVVVLERLHAH